MKISHIFPILLTSVCCGLVNYLKAQGSARDSLLRLNTTTYLVNGNIDSAILTASKLNPNNSPHFKNLALATLYEARRDTIKANSFFAASLAESNADSAETYYLLSMTYYHRGNIAVAKNQLLLSLQYDNLKPDRNFLLGKLYDYLNQPDSALIYYKTAYQEDSENLSYIQALYAAYSRKGMILTALPYLTRWAQIDTSNLQIQLTLISQWLDLDSAQTAIPLLTHLSTLYSTNDTVYYQIGLCSLQLKDTIRAMEALRIAIRLAPTPNVMYYEQQIGVYEAQGKTSLVLDAIQQGAKAGISFYKDWLTEYASAQSEGTRINALLSQKSPSSQLTDLLQLAEIAIFQRDDLNALTKLNTYRQLGGAMTDSVFYMQFIAELKLGRLDDAKGDIQKAISLSPSNVEYQTALANLLFLQKDYANLIPVLLNLPINNSPYFTLTERDALLFKAYTRIGDAANALKYYHAE